MRFLSVLRLALIDARFFGQIAAVKPIRDGFAGGRNSTVVHLHAIGSHIGYRAILIQTLRNAHGVAGGKTQFTRSFLLQGRCCKRRLRVAGYRLCFDSFDRKIARFNRKARLLRVRFGL